MAKWLDSEDIEKLFEDLRMKSVSELKDIFKREYENYCENDAALAGQILKIRNRVRLAS